MSERFIHPQAICDTSSVGKGTRIWAFAHVLAGAQIGENCNICEGVFIENDVIVGDDVTIKNGVQLWDGVRLGKSVFVGPNATFSNDQFPRSKNRPESFARTTVADDASIGANATILPGIQIGPAAMIGAGAVVIHDVPARAVMAGNPARMVGYAGATKLQAGSDADLPASFAAHLISLNTNIDRRGRLTVSDKDRNPFPAKRFFMVQDVPNGDARGSHAHRSCEQFFVAVCGQMNVALDDGKQAYVVRLVDANVGIYVPPVVWSVQYGHTAGAILLVTCSESYDRDDYISDYVEFSTLANRDR